MARTKSMKRAAGVRTASVALVLGIVTSIGIFLDTPGAAARTGDLTFAGCLRDSRVDPAGCVSADGLNNAQSIALSRDGRSAYVAASGLPSSPQEITVAAFRRDPSTGSLTFLQCLGLRPPCTPTPALEGGGNMEIVVSPDGTSVYVTTLVGDSIVGFDRDPITGQLSFDRCLRDQRRPSQICGPAPALQRPDGLDLSDDGRHLYVATRGSQSITVFDRDAGTSQVRFRGCVQDPSNRDDDPCIDVVGIGAQGGGPAAVDVAPDGLSVVGGGSTIVNLRRDPSTGDVAFVSCVRFSEGVSPNCALGSGPGGIVDVRFSDDSKNVYAASFAGVVSVFDRAGTSLLSNECFASVAAKAAACKSVPALAGAVALDVSADGTSLYVAAATSNAVGIFGRSTATGRLAFAGCISQTSFIPLAPRTCSKSAGALRTPFDVVVSDDASPGGVGPGGGTGTGRFVYVASLGSDAVAIFGRELPPPVAQGLVINPPPPETQIDAGPAAKSPKRQATFFFSSDPGNSFECSLDGSDFAPCTSPTTFTKLTPGAHTFQVAAIDGAGRRDETPAVLEFVVRKKRR